MKKIYVHICLDIKIENSGFYIFISLLKVSKIIKFDNKHNQGLDRIFWLGTCAISLKK